MDQSSQHRVSIIVGSTSDLPVIEETEKTLTTFGVPFERRILSAHRSPKKLRAYLDLVQNSEIEVVIAGAGAAAHLAGVIAAELVIPVIAVPLSGSPLKGIDSLFSMVQMPGGVPVATMGVGRAGARNAAVLATQILALNDTDLKQKLLDYKAELESRYTI